MKTLRASLQAALFIIAAFAPVARAQSPDGPWVGAINVMGTELKIMVTFASKGDSLSATIDIPQQMAIGLPLRNISWRPPKAHFELPAGPGLAVFDGIVRGDSVNGSFMQAGYTGTFRLERGKDVRTMTPPVAEAPPPYVEEDVTIRTDSLTIAGTLTIPRSPGRHPAVILITGSGAHNRDEEIFGYKPFRLIADYFTRHGLAVLRCDDRGVGGSTGIKSAVTTAAHAEDVLAELEFLRCRAEINPAQIGLCGHSEGGIIAPIAAAKSKDVAFIVLIAGPAVTGDKLICFQLESQMKEAGEGEEQIQKSLREERRVFECVRSDSGWDSLRMELSKDVASVYAALSVEKRKSMPDSSAFVKMTVDGKIATVRGPWFRYFIDFDPATALVNVGCPVLAIFGGLDMQVPVSLNKTPMESALGRSGTKDWIVEVLPKANHLFQTAVTGSFSEYAALPGEFTPGFLELMTGWITKRVAVSDGGAGGRGN